MMSAVRYTVSLCLFFVLVLAEVDKCPPDELIAPCRCVIFGPVQQVVCSNIADVSILQAMFEKSGGWPIRAFVLEDSNIAHIPAAALVRKDIRVLTILNSTLTSLFDAAPTGASNLFRLGLFGVKFQRGMQWSLMKNLRELKFIRMGNSEFRELGKEFIDNVSEHLETFDVYGTNTSSLDDRVFARMRKINSVEIAHGRITTLKRSMFAYPANLESFDFSENLIETLPDDMFYEMPHLERISLRRNRLKHFSEYVFGRIPSAWKFDLDENPIMCDCSIQWFMDYTRYLVVVARCAGPEDKKGLLIHQLKPAWFSYCQNSNTLLDAIE